MGDSSDNVPGVKGIGDKGAQELVNSYGSLENILAHVDEITKKRPREALQSQREEALLSKELVTIRQDLEVDLNLDAMRMTSPDLARLRTMYVELEFHTLARNIAVPEDTSTQPRRGWRCACRGRGAAAGAADALRDVEYDRRDGARRRARVRSAVHRGRSRDGPAIRRRHTRPIRCAAPSSV